MSTQLPFIRTSYTKPESSELTGLPPSISGRGRPIAPVSPAVKVVSPFAVIL